MEQIRKYIFIGGGLFLSFVFGYYACVADSLPISLLFGFYSLMAVALTFNDFADLKI